MAKGDKEKLQNKMAAFGDKLVKTNSDTPLQEVAPVQSKEEKPKENTEEGEKGFHLFIPLNVYWKVKETCVQEQTSMKNFINNLLIADMKQRGKIETK
jgi:hypothetical protein